jgi:hypothetical protein
MATSKITPVSVAGNTTIHAGRKVGKYASGAPRYAKLCSGSGRDRHEPGPASGPITCKRCLAKLPTNEQPARSGATGPRYTEAQLKKGLTAKKAGKSNAEVAKIAGVKSPAYFSKVLQDPRVMGELLEKPAPKRTVRRSRSK